MHTYKYTYTYIRTHICREREGFKELAHASVGAGMSEIFREDQQARDPGKAD